MQLILNLVQKFHTWGNISNECLCALGKAISLVLYSAHSLKLAGTDHELSSEAVTKTYIEISKWIDHQFARPFQVHNEDQRGSKVEEIQVR